MNGIPLLILLAACIGLMILAVSKWKVHPFPALMGTALLLALASGIDLTAVADVIGNGFSSAFTSVGLVIILGAMVGSVLEKTGAALKIADAVIRLTGKRYPEIALTLMGRVVSMSVFCDSAFVILDPVRKALARRTGRSGAGCAVALSMGLYITQCFTPPAPGPVAAANAIYSGMGLEVRLLQVIAISLLCSVLPTAAGYVFSRFVGKKTAESGAERNDTAKAYEAVLAGYGKLPGLGMSLAPILLPILLMSAAGVAEMNAFASPMLIFLGKPVIALTAGLAMALLLLWRCGQMNSFYDLTSKALQSIAPILFIIAAGNALGAVISATQLESVVKENASVLQHMGLLFPFLLAAMLKTALGSSTVAITTTAGILAPLMNTLGFATPVDAAMAVCAIAAGSMTVCHANDSYFWVVVDLSQMDLKEGYRTLTLGTLVVGLVAFLNVLLVSIFL